MADASATIKVQIEMFNLALVQDIIGLLAEAMPYVPADSLLVGRIADVLVRADEQAIAAEREIARRRARAVR